MAELEAAIGSNFSITLTERPSRDLRSVTWSELELDFPVLADVRSVVGKTRTGRVNLAGSAVCADSDRAPRRLEHRAYLMPHAKKATPTIRNTTASHRSMVIRYPLRHSSQTGSRLPRVNRAHDSTANYSARRNGLLVRRGA